MDSEQAWREYDKLIRTGDFSDGSPDWGRRERARRELQRLYVKTVGLCINGRMVVTIEPTLVGDPAEARE